MPLIKPRLITFDVTGTLLSTKPERFYAEVAKNYKLVDFNNQRAIHVLKESMKRLEVEHPNYGKHTGLGWMNWWRTVVQDVFKDQYHNIPPEKLEKIANNLIELYKTSKYWNKYPGTIELLESLNKRDVVLGIISNFDERLEAILDSKGMRSYFSFVLTPYNFGVGKPDSAIFQEAVRLSSRGLDIEVKPSEAIHIGDRVDRDYQGARDAQWRAILMNWNNAQFNKELVNPNDVFRNFEDLKIHLDVLFSKKSF